MVRQQRVRNNDKSCREESNVGALLVISGGRMTPPKEGKKERREREGEKGGKNEGKKEEG